MSLKGVHLVFIAMSSLLAFAFGGWCLRSYGAQEHLSYVAAGLVSFVAGAGLILYGIWFSRKVRRIR